jgi:hypothetical protein
MTEKRIRPRMHRRVPIRTDVEFSAEEIKGMAVLLEMSEGGLSMAAKEEVPLGRGLALRIYTDVEPIDLHGRVVYARLESKGFHYGVQFEGVSPGAAIAVRDFLKRHRFARFRM